MVETTKTLSNKDKRKPPKHFKEAEEGSQPASSHQAKYDSKPEPYVARVESRKASKEKSAALS